MIPRGLARAPIALLVALLSIIAAACSRRTPNIVIGSESTTEQSVVGEIVAQHVEKELGLRVIRRPNMGGTLLAYQGLQSGEVGIYPEYAGTIITEVLKEQPSANADQLFERAKGEMARIAQAQLIGPLGFDSSYVGVIRASDPHASRLSNLSNAAQIPDGWKLGFSFQFQQQPDAMPALTQYHLPTTIPVRPVDGAALYKSVEDGELTMIVTHATDGTLRSKDWKVLPDDRKLFTIEQLCLVVRQDLLKAEPRMASALSQLSGKLTSDQMRELNAEVDIDHRTVADAARGFLADMK
jgi:glycine betaine/choline ABC-type transport system substrate-binding protein